MYQTPMQTDWSTVRKNLTNIKPYPGQRHCRSPSPLSEPSSACETEFSEGIFSDCGTFSHTSCTSEHGNFSERDGAFIKRCCSCEDHSTKASKRPPLSQVYRKAHLVPCMGYDRAASNRTKPGYQGIARDPSELPALTGNSAKRLSFLTKKCGYMLSKYIR